MNEKALAPTETVPLVEKRRDVLAGAVAEALIDEWLEYERNVNDASKNTVAAYRKGMGVFVEWLKVNRIASASVTPQDVAQFKADLKERYGAQTVNLRLTAVRSFYRFAVTTGKTVYNPASEVKGVKRKKSRSHKRAFLTNGEVLGVLDACETSTLEGVRSKAILSLFAYCALRQVEVYRANIGDLRSRGDRLTLDVRGKGDAANESESYAIIPTDAEPAIRAWLSHRMTFENGEPNDPLFISLSNRNRGERLSLRSIRRLVKEHYRAAGVAGDAKTTHSLRHSAITNVIRHGATPMQVQSMARHQSFDTTLGYYHEVARLDNPAEDLIEYKRTA